MSRYDLGRDDLAALLINEPSYRVAQVLDGLHRRLAEPGELTELPKRLREELSRAALSSPRRSVM